MKNSGADQISLSKDGGVIVVDVASGVSVTTSDDGVGTSVKGVYGNLVLNEDGSYVYQVTKSVDKIPAGAVETFTYMIQDSDGSTSSASLSINVNTNTVPLAQDDSVSDLLFAGLVGEYYGTDSQLNNISDFRALVESKKADATFEAANINYGRGSSDVAQGKHLQEFLGSDASTLSTDPSDNTDGGIHLQGYVYLEAGTYNFKVVADDGYQITINGNAVATVDYNQSVNTVTHESFIISKSGYQAIDMIWWDQGGDYVFQPTLSADDGDTYFVLDSSVLSSTGEMPLTTLSEQALEINVDSLLANDIDADGDTLTVTSIGNVQNGYAYLNSEGNVVFTPASGFTGAASFDYTVSDGNGGADTATATINIAADDQDQAIVSVTLNRVEPEVPSTIWTGFEEGHTFDVQTTSTEWKWGSWGWYSVTTITGDDYKHSGSTEVNFKDVNGASDVLLDGNTNGSSKIETNEGKDFIQITGNSSAIISTGDDNDSVALGSSTNSGSSISLGTGDDSLYVNGNLTGSVDTGSGKDKILIEGNQNGSGTITTGSGNDTVVIRGDANTTISTGSDNDTVFVAKNLNSGANINTGSGDDKVFVGGNVNSTIDMSDGNDVLIIKGVVNGTLKGGLGTD